MPLVPLSDVLSEARSRRGYAVGLVCLGWEDAEAFVAAGEATGVPVILQAGPGARAHMPLAIWGAMFRELGGRANVPVVAHLDHGADLNECRLALDAGFTSVMFDGSALPLAENLEITRQVVELATNAGASVEAEIGMVGYSGDGKSKGTDPDEAAAMAELGLDALAVSLGNQHLQNVQEAQIDWDRARDIANVVNQPLVIHGGSGVPTADRARLAREFGVAKINIGTEYRQEHGAALRRALADDTGLFDRLAIARALRPALIDAAARLLIEGWNAGG